MIIGIILLMVVGFVSTVFHKDEKQRTIMAIIYGIAAALTIDEFALWLFLQDVYWTKEGKDSIEAFIVAVIIIVIAIIINEAYDRSLIGKIRRKFKRIK